ncbi:DUF2189 domain-containing protein [Chitinivorax sp. PXF-14]|uniref:DUF2189 domain-containing protein n=1 Tax=Chitinivorax sp. PXF-14 TaxID=3230488 RepID=UPI0034674D5D
MTTSPLRPLAVPPLAPRAWLVAGWRSYLAQPAVSSAYAALFVLAGLFGSAMAWRFDLLPMLYPLAMSFMLVGPVAATGFYRLSAARRAGQRPGLGEALQAWRGHAELWVLAIFSGFLWLIWMTDAAILYGLYFGSSHPGLLPQFGFERTWPAFSVFATLMWLLVGLIIFSVNALSVPLLFESRLSLPLAVGCSVRAIFGNPLAMFGWAIVLTLVVLVSFIVPLLFLVTLPVLAYGSEACYRDIYPPPA